MPTLLEKIERSLSESNDLRNDEHESLGKSEDDLALAHTDFAASVKENREMKGSPQWLEALQNYLAIYAVYALSALCMFIFSIIFLHLLINCLRRNKRSISPSV